MTFTSPKFLLQIAAVVVGSYFVYLFYRNVSITIAHRRQRLLRGCKLPKRVPSKVPLFGMEFIWDSYRALKEHRVLELMPSLYKAVNANTCELHIFFSTIYSTSEPENLKAVLSLDFKSWELPPERSLILAPILGEGIFTSNGPAWHRSRELLRPNFIRTQIGDIDMFERHMQHLIQGIPRDGSMVDLHPVFFNLSLDVATEFLFGVSTNRLAPGLSNEKATSFVESFDYLQNGLLGHNGKYGFLSLFLPDFTFDKHIQVLHTFVDDLISKALANDKSPDSKTSSTSRYTFLHALVSQTSDVVRIRSELLNILLAGRDTTASLLSNLWFEIARRPDIWSRLQSEVRTLNGERPTFEQLKSMKYLQGVINESNRLYPIVPENSRIAIADTQLPLGGGEDGLSPIFVPKGHVAHWSTYAMHRRVDLFGADAAEFIPDRWLDCGSQKGIRTSWEYLPFSGGPRICIGQQFALTEASYISVRLLQEFAGIESRDPEPWREKIGITVTGFGGCKVGLRARC